MSNWTAASSDCSRPANNYVRVNTVDLYTPNARFTQERLGYQVLTLFGKLGYSLLIFVNSRRHFVRKSFTMFVLFAWAWFDPNWRYSRGQESRSGALSVNIR